MLYRVEPFLYEIIVHHQYPYTTPNNTEMLINHGNSVRHLLLRDSMPKGNAWDYIHSCENILTLSFNADCLSNDSYAPRNRDSGQSSFPYPNVFPTFQHLTHLELLTPSSPLQLIGWLISLPNLTHLSVFSPMTNISEVVKRIFVDCRRIRMVLWCPWMGRFADQSQPTQHQVQAIKFEEPEPRLVICKIGYAYFTKLFIAHAKDESNSDTVWKLAEEIIKKRMETGIINYADIVTFSRY